MCRVLSLWGVGVWWAALALTCAAPAQEPHGVISAPQTDVYSVYTDAFYNPRTLNHASNADPAAYQGLWRLRGRHRLYFGYDILYYNRTKPRNTSLLVTSGNMFHQPDGTGPLLNGETAGAPLYGIDVTASAASNGLLRVGNPNDPNINARFDVNGNNLGNIGEFLIPGEVRMQTDDFDIDWRHGHRPRIGIELESGSRIEFSYFYLEDFQGGRLIDDVSGSAFLTKVISDDSSPFLVAYQRWGYLQAFFRTNAPEFGGERRRQVGTDPSPVPHFPPAENPPLPFAVVDGNTSPTSRDVPREPTVNDPDRLGVLIGPEETPEPSLLWQDGELAFADYAFNLQGAEISYQRPIFEWSQRNWFLTLHANVRYLAMDEMFSFFFADIAGFDTPIPAFSPFDRAQVNLHPAAQPSIETYAWYLTSVDNDIIGPELGLNARLPFLGVFEFDLLGKAGFGANFLQNHNSVYRGDGFVLYDYTKHEVATSGIFEGRLGLNINPHPNVQLRGGWEFMWLVNVGTAMTQISFDLDQRIRPNSEDNILFYGWFAGGEITF